MKKYFLLLLLIALVPAAGFAASKKNPSKLTLSAQSTIRKAADELQIKIAVITIGESAEGSLAENSQKMHAVIDSLQTAGFTKDDYETGQFSIRPTYTPYPQYAPHDWKPSINGYEVSHSISIHTDKLDMAGKIIDLSNKAGANSISDIRFTLRNPHQYWNEALLLAGSTAVNDATALAHATGVKLGRVLNISLNNTQVHSPQVNASYLAKAMAGDSAPPIEPGDVSLTAHVTIEYEIH